MNTWCHSISVTFKFWCWVPRKSVLRGSSAHKATLTAQNLKVTLIEWLLKLTLLEWHQVFRPISNVICLVKPQNGSWVLFTISGNSLYRGSLYQGLSVLTCLANENSCFSVRICIKSFGCSYPSKELTLFLRKSLRFPCSANSTMTNKGPVWVQTYKVNKQTYERQCLIKM